METSISWIRGSREPAVECDSDDPSWRIKFLKLAAEHPDKVVVKIRPEDNDGAVIIRDTRVASAACVLNLSDSEGISKSLGTRHRAGLGISETTDATVLIVSEETGIISMARDGKLTRYLDEEKIVGILSGIYNGTGSGRNSLLKILKGKGAEKDDE